MLCMFGHNIVVIATVVENMAYSTTQNGLVTFDKKLACEFRSLTRFTKTSSFHLKLQIKITQSPSFLPSRL